MESSSLEETASLGPRRSNVLVFSLGLVLIMVAIAFLQFRLGPEPFGLEALALAGGPRVQIEDLTVGEGQAVTEGVAVSVHYIGWLDDNTQIDSSYDRGQPFVFTVGLGQVIPGWDQGLMGMQVGGKRLLTIPPELAYGDQGVGEIIPPGSTLVFEVELVAILQVEIEELVAGEGPEAGAGNTLTIQYTLWLEDGTLVDSSEQSGPVQVTLGVGGIIFGLEQGIVGMKAGERRLVTIPPELAFGSQGAGTLVPPNATLIFEVELVSIDG